jgi:hypothetical protein
MQAVSNASTDLKSSKCFQELLNVSYLKVFFYLYKRFFNSLLTLKQLILMLGNFLNGTGYQGGAFGIKISSINKLVDTKGSKDNTTLLHFLVDIVESKFPRIYGFFDDLKGMDAACKGKYLLIEHTPWYNMID